MSTLPLDESPNFNVYDGGDEDDNYPGSGTPEMVLQFPQDLGDAGTGHAIYFFFLKDAGAGRGDETAAGIDVRALEGPREQKATIDSSRTSGLSGKLGREFGQGLASKVGFGGAKFMRSTLSVGLYLPAGIGTSYEHEWGAQNTGGLFTAALTKTQLFKNLFNSGSVSEVLNNIGELVSGQSVTAAKFLIISAASTVAGDGGGNALAKAFIRQEQNPRVEFLYNQTALRSFTYEFTMVPRSRKEMTEIHKIVQAFKEWAAPSIVDNEANFFRFPNLFEIEYHAYDKENSYLNKISTCALTQISVDYTTENQPAFFRPDEQGAPPVTTKLTLQFKEMEILTRERIADGGF